MKFFKSEKFKKFIFGICSFILIFCMFSVNVLAAENTNTENFLSSGGLSFNVWSLYRNSLTFAVHNSSGQFIDKDTVFTNDNTVVKDTNGVTTISNENSLLYTQIDANTISAFSLSVPTTRLEPVLYLNDNYLGLNVVFNCSFTVSFDGVDLATFNSIKEKPLKPYFNIYYGTDKYSYSDHYCKVLSSRLEAHENKTVTYSYVLSTSFSEAGYIVGFWTKFYWEKWGLTFTDNNASTFSWLTWTLSPMVWFYPAPEKDIFIDEGTLIDWSNSMFDSPDLPSLSQQLTKPDFRTSVAFITNKLNLLYNEHEFIRFLIDLSLSIGILCVVLGIGTQVFSSIGKDK